MSFSVRFPILAAGAVLAVCAIGPGDWNAIVPAHAQQSQPAAVPTTVTAAGITLHSVSIELPGSDQMFPGDAAAEAINNNCLACHSAEMVLTQPNLSQSVWQQEVEKMRSQYKAPVDEQDVPAIVAYLASHKGTQ
jgi:hypothetical protein